MEENIRNNFYKNLRKYMSAEGKTQADLCRYMKISGATASDWYNGVKIPRIDKLQAIADWLGIELSDLLSDKPKPDDGYYVDDYVRDLARFLHHSPEYRVAFDATRKVKADDLETVISVLDKFRGVQ